ncbi:MAG: Inorganic pyrophosphatase [Candidatus Bathyarchaeota archaeon BA1]|nr:MAG: Inorganic pyrophosphatase [Candidatus Bathyarchaeota archaeon BA1]
MILSYEPMEVGCIIKARPIGVLIMEDEDGEDPKILSVPVRDPRFGGFNDIADVHPHKLRESKNFSKSTRG